MQSGCWLSVLFLKSCSVRRELFSGKHWLLCAPESRGEAQKCLPAAAHFKGKRIRCHRGADNGLGSQRVTLMMGWEPPRTSGAVSVLKEDMKEESEKAGLKLNIQKTKIMASGPITSWPIEGEKVEAVTDFIFLGSKITVGGDCSHEIAPWKKSYGQPRQHVKKQRHHFADKGPHTQGYGFSSSHIQMWELDHKESWVPNNWLWCCRRITRVLWTARRSNQSILKEINSEYSLEGLMLKLQSFGHLMWRTDSLEKTLMLGKIEGRKRRGWQSLRWLDHSTASLNGHEFEQTPGDSGGQRSLACCSSWCRRELDVT